MILNLIDELDIKGHLTISKLYKDGKEEVVFDDHNIIVSGMGVGLAHMFSLSGSNSILDYQIDRFQIGLSGNAGLETSTTYQLSGPLSSLTEYVGNTGNTLVTSGYQIKNNSVVNTGVWYGIIPQQNITRIDQTTVRYTILIDQESCNNLRTNASLTEIGLFIKNIKNNDPVAPILVAYRYFSPIRKTSDFAIVFRWSINF